MSTPETGVDSIAVTYALLGPVMCVIRPCVSIVTAIIAGIGVERVRDVVPVDDRLCRECGEDPCACEPTSSQVSWVARLTRGMRFAYVSLLGDIGGWFLLGIAIAGVIGVLVPDDLLAALPGGRVGPLVLMLVVGMPMYVCATASTPIAAALAVKGLSPGAVLVFLLAGPATNAASLAVVTRIIGRRGTVVYLAAIAGCAVLAGMVVDLVYGVAGWRLAAARMPAHEDMYGAVTLVCAVLLLVLTARALWRRRTTPA